MITEEYAREILDHVCINVSKFPREESTKEILMIERTINELKRLGYIHLNPVEEWEEMIKEHNNCAWEENDYFLHEKLIKSFDEKLKLANNAIQYLKNKNGGEK